MPQSSLIQKKLIQPRNRNLLDALLGSEKFGYEQLAEKSGRSASALRVQFHRWEALGMTLLQQVGTVSGDGPGRNRRLFRLNPKFRDDVVQALEKIRSERVIEERDTLPDLRSAEDALLNAMSDAELDLSVGYYIARHTLDRLQRVREKITSKKPEALGFRVSDKLRENLIGQMSIAELLIISIRKQISEKPDDIKEKEERAVWYANQNFESGPERMAPYFAEIPDRSVSGFGGILSARKYHSSCSAIDDYLRPELKDFEPGGRLRLGFVHVLKESMELEKIDPSNWSGIVDRLWDGADRCTPIRDLPELSHLQKTIEENTHPNGGELQDSVDPETSSQTNEVEFSDGVAEDLEDLEDMPGFRMPESRMKLIEEKYKAPWKALFSDAPPEDTAAAFIA